MNSVTDRDEALPFIARFLYPVELEFGDVGLNEMRKTRCPEKNSRSKARTNSKFKTTYSTVPEATPGHAGGQFELRHCAFSTPLA